MYDNLEELLTLETLSGIEGHQLDSARVEPFQPYYSATGNHFLSVSTSAGKGHSYIVKRMSLEWDWIMHATQDHLCRDAQLWRAGILDRMPEEIDHAVVACARDGDGWAILMTDHRASFDGSAALDARSNRCYLRTVRNYIAEEWYYSRMLRVQNRP